MSGTLMDGGQGGDGSAVGGHSQSMGDSVSFDANHGNHSSFASHHVQAGSGGDGFLANLLGQNGQHSFLGHLLGLDGGSNAAHGHGHGHGAQMGHGVGQGQAPSQSIIWTSALQALKVSNFTAGLKFTPAMGMFCLFSGFVIWLFVIYFVRHHEPFANSVLGTVPQSLAVSTDRNLINGVRGAMPFKTSKHTGEFYTPGAEIPAAQQMAAPQVISNPPAFTSAPAPTATESFGAPRPYSEVMSPQVESAPVAGFQPYASQAVVPSAVSNGFASNQYYASTTDSSVGRVVKIKTFTNH